MNFKRTFYLYFRFMKLNLRAMLEYRADFLIMLISAAFTQLLGIIFLWVIYQRVPDINGWQFYEVAFIYAMIFLTEGFASFCFEGTWMINSLVNKGELDQMLLRPVSPVLQILSSKMGINGISNIVIGSIIILQSLAHVKIEWSVMKALMIGVFIVSAIVIRFSVNFAASASVFWTHNPRTAFSFMVHGICDFAKYPLTIYNFGLQVFITAIIPYAFISFFPAAYLFEKGDLGYWGLLSPIVAIYCFLVARSLFYLGLKKYESAGN